MTKQELIDFLKEEESKRSGITHWSRVYTNSDDYWNLTKPGVDWLEDDMDISKEGVVKITYNKSLYGQDDSKVFESTYDDFKANYNKTTSR